MLGRFAKHFNTRFVSDRELGADFADAQMASRLGYVRVPQGASRIDYLRVDQAAVPGRPSSLGEIQSKEPIESIPFARRTDTIDSSPIGAPMPELWERCKRFFDGLGERPLFAQKAFQVYHRLVKTHWQRFSAAVPLMDLLTCRFSTKDGKSFVQFGNLHDHGAVIATDRNVDVSFIFIERGVVRLMGPDRQPVPVAAYQDPLCEKCIELILVCNGWPVNL